MNVKHGGPLGVGQKCPAYDSYFNQREAGSEPIHLEKGLKAGPFMGTQHQPAFTEHNDTDCDIKLKFNGMLEN